MSDKGSKEGLSESLEDCQSSLSFVDVSMNSLSSPFGGVLSCRS